MTDAILDESEVNIYKSEKREVASDYVVNIIKRLLITRKLKPGDKLPSETDLAQKLNVSRGSVREAMKTLSAYGIVKVKRGDGTYIADSTEGIVFDPLLFKLITSKGNLNELKELREMIELGVIKHAISNATVENIKTLKHIYEFTATKIKNGEFKDEVLIETELMFHSALGQATDNKLLQTIYNFVMDLYIPNIYSDKSYKIYGEEVLGSHKPIIDAIINRDYEAGEMAIKSSVDVWKNIKGGEK